jgi:hypothetical protein
MAKAKAAVILTAGYPGNAAVIFQGDARTIDHVRDGAEWITHIQCGDGERAYQFARFAESFAPGTAIADVIRACARALAINTGNLDEVLAAGGFRGNLTQFAHGYTAHGKASAELDKPVEVGRPVVVDSKRRLAVAQGRRAREGAGRAPLADDRLDRFA